MQNLPFLELSYRTSYGIFKNESFDNPMSLHSTATLKKFS